MTDGDRDTALLTRAWAAAVVGDEATLSPLPLASRALRAFARGERPGERDSRNEDSSLHPALDALARARCAAYRFDATDLAGQLASARAALVDSAGLDLELALLGAWFGWLTGEPDVAEVEALTSAARRDGVAWITVDATSLASLVAGSSGDHAGAVDLARRASRMARVERLAPQHVVASMALARARRLAGSSHVAEFIVQATAAACPAYLETWRTWEGLLAGVIAPARCEDAYAAPLADMLACAVTGDHSAYLAAVERARAAFPAGPHTLEIDALHTLVDPLAPLDDASADLLGFAAGLDDEAPRGLSGLCSVSWSPTDVAGAWVLGDPEGAGRRILPMGRSLVAAATAAIDDAKSTRTATMLAALALAGPVGVDESELFQRIYGFAYRPERHAGTRRVLYHRARSRLPEGVTLIQEGERLRLALPEPMLFLDPRCAPSTAHAVLRVLVGMKNATTKDVATALGIPLRTAQNALRQLVEDGVCESVKATRETRYTLSDTTFSELTRFE
ncbi:MAG: hypothetical protein AB7S26_30440 [Sandaracinaceae bacterium]